MRAVELFAGVGGFRIGLEGSPNNLLGRPLKVIWSNQWEPTTKKQHAAEIYTNIWSLKPSNDDDEIFLGKNEMFVNKNIAEIDTKDIPEHELLCGGFPCQDYSVAKTANKATGISGKKGVLWWEIHRIIKEKIPDFVLLENVDRLLKSPTSQRGRDFAVMLTSLDELGYVVEWKEFAASIYGFPQRRRRVYILAYGPKNSINKQIRNGNPEEWMMDDGILAKAFPSKAKYTFGVPTFSLRKEDGDDLADVSDGFNKEKKNADSPFLSSGVMIQGKVWNTNFKEDYEGPFSKLSDVLVIASLIPDEFIIKPGDMLREKGWIYLKGGKSEPRNRNGFIYNYKEGPVTFPDNLGRPSRTIITGEGGAGASRFKHVVEFTPTKKQYEKMNLSSDEALVVRKRLSIGEKRWVRRLIPLELERLNMFPDNHTNIEGISDSKRAFLMGNALVCGVIDKIAEEICKRL